MPEVLQLAGPVHPGRLVVLLRDAHQAGFYGLSTAGNVVLFVLVSAIVLPLFAFLNRRTVEL